MEGRDIVMNIGNQILNIREEKKLTQEEFGMLFHVTRQTVSNWENGKSYPDLQILVSMSNQFDISLDVLLKEDPTMVLSIDKERTMSSLKRQNTIIDSVTGAGTGLVISCIFSSLKSLVEVLDFKKFCVSIISPIYFFFLLYFNIYLKKLI